MVKYIREIRFIFINEVNCNWSSKSTEHKIFVCLLVSFCCWNGGGGDKRSSSENG